MHNLYSGLLKLGVLLNKKAKNDTIGNISLDKPSSRAGFGLPTWRLQSISSL